VHEQAGEQENPVNEAAIARPIWKMQGQLVAAGSCAATLT
jgi:hypothetical protein